MLTLLKYELKSRKNILLGGSLTIILLNILLIVDMKVNHNYMSGFGMEGPNLFGGIIWIVLFAIWIASIVLIIMDSVNILRRDLYEDTGQLLFTVPESSYSILLSKMLTTVVELLLFGLLYGILITSIFIAQGMDFESIQRLTMIIGDNLGLILQGLAAGFVSLMTSLGIIYFSLVLTKSLFKNKKHSGLTAFGVFLALSFGISRISNLIFNYSPNNSGPGMTLQLNDHIFELSITPGQSLGLILFNICIFLVLFLSSAYLLEHKADI